MNEVGRKQEKHSDLESMINSMNVEIKIVLDKIADLSTQVKQLSSKFDNIQRELTLQQQELIKDFTNEKNNGTILIIKHPSNECLKMLVVLDNLISDENTNFVKEKINKWFSEIDTEYMLNYDLLYASFINEFAELILDNEGLSLSASILDNKKTMTLSTSDKRIYSCVNGDIYELVLSPSPNYSFINSMLIDNDEYTTIMLLSNGVEEEIEDNKIKIITKKTNRDSLAKELLESTQEEKNIISLTEKTDKS